MESVPVPVRSGRCSPLSRMSRTRERYWCSSCCLAGPGEVWPFISFTSGFSSTRGPLAGPTSIAVGAMLLR